ncbi:alpha-sarcoglycan [Takifugu rubripes]|uniref:Sarcoglycan, alpha n=1 Tax=Takifugu rubripes TaxID=31033 RepID=H2TDL2_TAKRU|nr:alpha-sarcoglycan-like [Takifugu rubripes]XP_029701631.1 alpha-sarcoglycan-like [Takifugu rubripes]|eukprot:XP_003961076.2 PREDICTED: alpha-sarcoglycan-like [Takifugu rubripes]
MFLGVGGKNSSSMSSAATPRPLHLPLSITGPNKMAGDWSCVFSLAVCVASLLGANAEIKLTIPVGRIFTYELMRETFQNDFEPLTKLYGRLYGDPITFKCNLQNFPDLPEWLRFTQRHQYDNGFLYGSPTSPGKNVIEIYATNKRSYEVVRHILVIKVVAEKMLPYQAEFFIKLREIEKVLPSSVQDEIRQDLQKLWDTEALEIVNISNALDRGGRVPLPLAGHFEGVYVKVGSEQYFSNCLLMVLRPQHQKQCRAGAKVKAPGGCNFCSIPSNCISWCKTELFDLTKQEPSPPPPTVGPGILESGGEFDPLESPPSVDFFPDYIVTVIVPLIIAIVLCLLLAYIMFGRREGVQKRNARTNQIQLYHHQTIHGNTDELRNMAGSRRVPPPLSTLPMFNSRTGDESPPLQSDSPSIPLIMAQYDPHSDTLPRK